MARRTDLRGEGSPQKSNAEAIRVNGYQQVLDLLRAADPAFRESLLRRIEHHDYRLGASLREQLHSIMRTP